MAPKMTAFKAFWVPLRWNEYKPPPLLEVASKSAAIAMRVLYQLKPKISLLYCSD